jgi:hypothetical protein
LDRLQTFGIDYEAAMNKLQVDGLKAFTDSFTDLLQTLEHKREAIVSRL